jgi:hypothetical protein
MTNARPPAINGSTALGGRLPTSIRKVVLPDVASCAPTKAALPTNPATEPLLFHFSEELSLNVKQLGNSDLHITPIGIGGWAMGGGNWEWGWGHQNDSDSIHAIDEGLEAGVELD